MDEQYMRRALTLAERGAGHTAPNPMVGCVIVKNGKVIGEGYHEQYGGLHAERNALQSCKEDPSGADLYVTLEPCCHHGKTPPCTDAIIEHQIARVIVGTVDDNPLVGGRGSEILKAEGIQVKSGVLETECRRLNEVFFHYINKKQPFVAMKYAMTLDGKICTENGDSKWITGTEARQHVHYLRKKYRGIMVGSGTILADDPMLDCRTEAGVNPVRIICDTRLVTPLNSRLVQSAGEIPTFLAYCRAEGNQKAAYEKKGVKLIACPEKKGVDLAYLMEWLGAEGIDSILLEGGGTLNGAMLEGGHVQKVYAYIAPKLVGGKGKSPVRGNGAAWMRDAWQLKDSRLTHFNGDYLIEGYPEGRILCSQES